MDDQQCREAIEARLAVLGWSRAELARRAGYAASSITNLLNDTREFGEGPRLRLGVALGIDLGTSVTPFGQDGAPTPSASLNIPVDAVLTGGAVQDQTIVLGHRREGKAPREELVRIEGAGEKWRALRVAERAWVDLGDGAVVYDLRPRDLIVLAPADERPPVHGSLVLAEKAFRSVAEAAQHIGEHGAEMSRELRVYRELDGAVWLWPLEGEGQPADPARLVAPWAVLEVAVRQQRDLEVAVEQRKLG